jgi:predicted molibdopterin-dependent oxidoreductase YjgC
MESYFSTGQSPLRAVAQMEEEDEEEEEEKKKKKKKKCIRVNDSVNPVSSIDPQTKSVAVKCAKECKPIRVTFLRTILTDKFISSFVSGRDIPCFIHI